MSRSDPALAIAPGGAADLDAVMTVMTSAFPAEFGEAWTRAQCAGILPMAGVSLTLASRDGAPVGFSLERSVGDEAELLLIGVKADCRRQGIASRLLDHFVATSRRKGLHHLHLEVRDGNPALHLYRAYGFDLSGRRTAYYRGRDGRFHDALTLSLYL